MYFPPEWHEQAFVQLTWPSEHTDWRYMLDEITTTYKQLQQTIERFEPVFVVSESLCPINDTWARDHAFLTTIDNGRAQLHDFQFNGWGGKFEAQHDNAISLNVLPQIEQRYAPSKADYIDELDFVLEGGSIEVDEQGNILTTTSCLLNPNRNPNLTKTGIEKQLRQRLGAKDILWIDGVQLLGDDTDGHIDTIARFAPGNTIIYNETADANDPHYAMLQSLRQQLEAFGRQLIPLPMPAPIFDQDNQPLPATYANFLILNGAVLLPTYRQPDNDLLAAKQLTKAFPGRQIVALDAVPLIQQHGSIHCATMQFPKV